MALDSFNVYHSYLKALEPLSDAECGRLLKACLIYSMTGEVPELRGNERFLFPSWQSQIDRDRAKYEARCKQNAQNISVRWNTDEYDGIRTYTKRTKDKDKDKDKDKEKDNGKRVITRFAPPSLAEVTDYCRERGNGVDPERFVDFYAAKGWKVGNQPMKDWRAAVRTWEKREERSLQKPRRKSFAEIAAEMDKEGRT